MSAVKSFFIKTVLTGECTVLLYQNSFCNGHKIHHFHITKNGSTDL